MIWRNYVTVTLCIQDQKNGHWLCGHNCIIRFSLHWQMSNRQQLQWMRRLRSSKTQRTTCGMSAVGTLPHRHRWSLELHPLCSPDLQSYTNTILMHVLQFSRLPPTVYPHLLQKRTYQDNLGRFPYRHDALPDTKPTASKHWRELKALTPTRKKSRTGFILARPNYSVSKKTSHVWLAITLTHVNGFWYFLPEMLPMK